MSSLTSDLARLANSANVLATAITVNSTSITSLNVAGISINSSGYTGDANNASYLGGTAAAGYAKLSGAAFTGNVSISGNLIVTGTTVTVNATTLDVKDTNITIAKGASTNSLANGAGLTVDPANAQFFYDDSINNWVSNIGLKSANVTTTTNVATIGTAVYVAANGNIGMGPSPSSIKLHVKNNNSADLLRLEMGGANGGTWDLKVGGAGWNDKSFIIGRRTDGADSYSLYINNSDYVGIGTNSPSTKLFIDQSNSAAYSDGNAGSLTLKGWAGGGKAYTGIRFAMYEHTSGWGSDIQGYDDTGSYGGALYFRTGTGAATNTPTTKMVICSNGNVGIGNTAPTRNLYVQGTIGFTASSNNTGYPWIMGSSAWTGSGPATTNINSVSGLGYWGDAGSQLFTFSSAPGVMSLQTEGSLFLGEGGSPYNPFTITGGSGGCLLVYNNASVGGQFAANSTVTFAGQYLYMDNATSQHLHFRGAGVAAPSFTNRSAGTKIVFYPEVGASTSDYAMGIDNATLWRSVPGLNYSHKWYAGTTEVMRLQNRKLYLYNGTPTSAQGYHDYASFIIDSSGQSYIQFRNTGDDGSYQGLIFSDNNLGGYVVHGNGNSYDGLRIAGYSGISFDIAGTDGLTTLPIKTQRGYMSNDANFYWFGEIHGTKFVDRNNTAYYVDPASTSNFYNMDLVHWRVSLNRAWENYPSVTIYNTTDQGPQGEFRFHGINGANGGDYSVVVRSDGGYATGSDSRRKINVETIDDALERICQLSGKTFNMINKDGDIETDLSENGKKFGIIAQDSIDIIPEAIKYYPSEDRPEENDGWASAYSIDYPSLTALLIEAVKQLKTEFDEYKATHP